MVIFFINLYEPETAISTMERVTSIIGAGVPIVV